MKIIASLCILMLLTACQSSPSKKVIYPETSYQDITWTVEESKKEIAIRHLHRSKTASTHLIRLKGNEFPHYHDRHDLTVTALSGKSIIHFKERQVKLNPGDVIFVPKGTYHWAENTDSDASVVFAVFSPGFDGKDRRKAE